MKTLVWIVGGLAGKSHMSLSQPLIQNCCCCCLLVLTQVTVGYHFYHVSTKGFHLESMGD